MLSRCEESCGEERRQGHPRIDDSKDGARADEKQAGANKLNKVHDCRPKPSSANSCGGSAVLMISHWKVAFQLDDFTKGSNISRCRVRRCLSKHRRALLRRSTPPRARAGARVQSSLRGSSFKNLVWELGLDETVTKHYRYLSNMQQ